MHIPLHRSRHLVVRILGVCAPKTLVRIVDAVDDLVPTRHHQLACDGDSVWLLGIHSPRVAVHCSVMGDNGAGGNTCTGCDQRAGQTTASGTNARVSRAVRSGWVCQPAVAPPCSSEVAPPGPRLI